MLVTLERACDLFLNSENKGPQNTPACFDNITKQNRLFQFNLPKPTCVIPDRRQKENRDFIWATKLWIFWGEDAVKWSFDVRKGYSGSIPAKDPLAALQNEEGKYYTYSIYAIMFNYINGADRNDPSIQLQYFTQHAPDIRVTDVDTSQHNLYSFSLHLPQTTRTYIDRYYGTNAYEINSGVIQIKR